MPDRKYEQKQDRLRVDLDFKQRVIDLMANNQPLPSVGIYDEPVRYFKANLEWCKVIFGWLDWLEDIAGWKEASDDNYAGIQAILIFEEGIEPMVLSQAEMKAAICEGLECWSESLAKRFLSGSKVGFSIDEDGNIVIDSEDNQGEIIEDDPATVQDESAMSKDGKARSMADGYNSVILKLNTLYGPVNGSPLTALVNTQEIMKNLFAQVDNPAAMDAAVEMYYTRRGAASTYLATLDPDGLGEFFFCNDLDERQLPEYIYGLSGDFGATNNAIELCQAVDQDLVSAWIDAGTTRLSTAFVAYGCWPFDTEIITFSGADFAGTNYKQGSVFNKPNHRVILEVEGKIVDTVNGGYQDFFWRVAADGTKTLVGISGSAGTFQVNSNWDEPTAEEVPFRADGKYVVSRDTFTASTGFLSIRRKMTNPAVGGQFTMKITDVGEVE